MNTLQTITETNPCFLCCFCKSGVVDDIKFGQLFMFDGVVVHYFCMLFSAALSQHGKDDEGILGFLPNDIMGEVRRSFRLKCTFCSTTGASVGCCNKKCRTAFHFPCGLQNGANYQFFGNYESYCADHVDFKKINLPKKDWVCPICTSQVVLRIDAVQPTKCCGSAVFHKECLQKLALSSGYFYKCPMCNNGKEFVQEMRSQGIFVPEQDASWEREPNAFEELYRQHSECDAAPACLCPNGKTYSAQKGNWILARCRICGAAGTHKLCSSLSTVENWACEPCFEVEKRTEKEKEKQKALIKTEPEKTVVKKKKVHESEGTSEQEAHVSARSGNRKVRNGRLNNRPSPQKKSQWKLSDLFISRSCFWYFPYGRQKLAKFEKRGTIPDHRKLCLTVNLVNWIPKSLFQTPDSSSANEIKVDPSYIEKKVLITNNKPATTASSSSSSTRIKKVKKVIKQESHTEYKVVVKTEVDSVDAPLPPAHTLTKKVKNKKKIESMEKKLSRKRKSLWDKGVIKKKKKCIKKEVVDDHEGNDRETMNVVGNPEMVQTHNNNPINTVNKYSLSSSSTTTSPVTLKTAATNDSSDPHKLLSPGTWTIKNPEDIVHRNLEARQPDKKLKDHKFEPRNLFDIEGKRVPMNSKFSSDGGDINKNKTTNYYNNEMDIQSNLEVPSNSGGCEKEKEQSNTLIKLSSKSLSPQLIRSILPSDVPTNEHNNVEPESTRKNVNSRERTEKRSSGSESGISVSMDDDIEMADESKSISEESTKQQQVSKESSRKNDELLPLTELNTDMSPTKLSFLMSSQKGLIQEELPSVNPMSI